MVITEYNITKSFDKKTGKIRYIITKDREIVYDMTFKLSKNRNTPFSPIDFLEAAGSSSNLVVISFLFQLSSSFLILLKVVDMFAF